MDAGLGLPKGDKQGCGYSPGLETKKRDIVLHGEPEPTDSGPALSAHPFILDEVLLFSNRQKPGVENADSVW